MGILPVSSPVPYLEFIWSTRTDAHVDRPSRTTNPAVCASGDSADTEGMPLTPVAMSEPQVAASNILNGTTATPDYAGIPTAVFTISELARRTAILTYPRDALADDQ